MQLIDTFYAKKKLFIKLGKRETLSFNFFVRKKKKSFAKKEVLKSVPLTFREKIFKKLLGFL